MDEGRLEIINFFIIYQSSDTQVIYGCDSKGNAIILKLVLGNQNHGIAFIQIRLENGVIYSLPGEYFSTLIILKNESKLKKIHISNNELIKENLSNKRI